MEKGSGSLRHSPLSTLRSISKRCRLHLTNANETRKLSYRKDDRAMRPMYGCRENFRESL